MGNNLYPLVFQKTQREFTIGLTDASEMVLHHRTAEKLCMKPVPLRPQLQQAIDQEFHRVKAVAIPDRAFGGLVREQKVVHAPDPRDRIPQATGDAGSKDRNHHCIFVPGCLERSLDDMDGLVVRWRCSRSGR